MNRLFTFLIVLILVTSCNITVTTFTFIYNDEGPNREIAERMEQLLESSFYNVDIVLIEGEGTEENLDSLMSGSVDIALVENYVNFTEGVNSAFSVYSEVLHIFYKEEVEVSSFQDLVYGRTMYIGKQKSPTYNLMMDLFDFYGVDLRRVSVTFQMAEADVVVELTNLRKMEDLAMYNGFKLFSFDQVENVGSASSVEGVALKYPRLSPIYYSSRSLLGLY